MLSLFLGLQHQFFLTLLDTLSVLLDLLQLVDHFLEHLLLPLLYGSLKFIPVVLHLCPSTLGSFRVVKSEIDAFKADLTGSFLAYRW